VKLFAVAIGILTAIGGFVGVVGTCVFAGMSGRVTLGRSSGPRHPHEVER
jgi:hypothetical protein